MPGRLTPAVRARRKIVNASTCRSLAIRRLFTVFGVVQFYKAADAEQICRTHGIRFSVPRIQQNIKGFDIQFRTKPDEFVIGGCDAADPLLAPAFFKRKMNASQFGGLLECNGSRLPCKKSGHGASVLHSAVPKCLSAVQTGGLLLVLSYQNKPCRESANLRRRSEISVQRWCSVRPSHSSDHPGS